MAHRWFTIPFFSLFPFRIITVRLFPSPNNCPRCVVGFRPFRVNTLALPRYGIACHLVRAPLSQRWANSLFFAFSRKRRDGRNSLLNKQTTKNFVLRWCIFSCFSLLYPSPIYARHPQLTLAIHYFFFKVIPLFPQHTYFPPLQRSRSLDKMPMRSR